MTSSNGNGRPHGSNRLPANVSLPSLSGPAELGGKEMSSGSAPAGASGDAIQVVSPGAQRPPRAPGTYAPENSVSGLELPAEFSGAHFLDAGFLAGIANDLFHEVGPAATTNNPQVLARGFADEGFAPVVSELQAGPEIPFVSTNDPQTVARKVGDEGAAPGLSALQSGRFDPFDLQDPRLFLGLGEAPDAPVGAELLGGKGVDPNGAEGLYYFLTPEVAAPTVPATPASPTPAIAAPAVPSSRPFSVEAVRRDFPILHQNVHGKPLIWLDNAATTQKPRQVIDALSRFYERDNSNIHRAAHTLAARATGLYEEAREKVRRFLGAGQVEEIVFVRGATEAINLVAQTYGRQFIGPGDEIVLSTIEHHANIVPWQHLAKEKGAVLRVIPVNDRGEVMLDAYEKLLGPKTKLVAVTQVSNALGTVLPVRTMAQLAHRHGAKLLMDAAQSVPHMATDVQLTDCDFCVFSGHKVFAPTGIGVLYGKRALLDAMPPWQGGGNMIDQVTFEETTYQPAPAKFEAGTGILAGAVGLGAAIDYLDSWGMDNISKYEHDLLVYATEQMSRVPGLRLIGTAAEKASVLSFVLDGVRNEDVGRYLDQEGIAVRASHHCAQPTMRRFGLESTVRPSLAFYNTHAEVDALVSALRRARSYLN